MGSATFAPVAAAHAYAATFSPDGRHIAFVKSRPVSINVVAVDGSTLIRTLSDPSLLSLSVTGLAWPEARRILFTSCSPSSGFCAVNEVAVDPSGNLSEPPRELWRMRARGLQGLSFAAGRMSVVVVEERDQIRVADLAKGGRSLEGPWRAFTNDEATNRDPSWLPDGRLSFYSDRDNETAIYAQEREGTMPVLLVGSPVDGRKWEGHENEALRTGEVIYQRPDDAGAGASRIVVATPGGEERELARVATHADVGFVRCGGGDPAKCVLGLSRESTMTLAHIDLASGRTDPPLYRGTDIASFAVSPDGRQVALVERTPEVTVIDVATGHQHTVTTTPRGRSLQDVEFTRDGKTLLLTGQDFSGGVLYGLIAVGLDGRGAMLQSSIGQATEPHVAFDNRKLAVVDWVVSTNAWVVEPQEK
jgi:WD40 repeat protein